MTDLFAHAVSVAERRFKYAAHGFRRAREKELQAARLAQLKAEIRGAA